MEDSRFKTEESGRDVMHQLFASEPSLFRVTLPLALTFEDTVEDTRLTLLIERKPDATVAYRHPNGDLVFEITGRFSEESDPFKISLLFIRGETDLVGAEVVLSPESIEEARKLLKH